MLIDIFAYVYEAIVLSIVVIVNVKVWKNGKETRKRGEI